MPTSPGIAGVTACAHLGVPRRQGFDLVYNRVVVRHTLEDWGGLIAWAILGAIVAFAATKHLWFDAIPAGDKALFWSTLLGPAVAALGWYVAAHENYRKNRQLETERHERERRGVVRQVNLLLRMAVKSLDDFFWIFKSPQLSYALLTWNRLSELLYDRASATSLSDSDYRALEEFWSRFGKMIAMAEDEFQRWTNPEAEHDYPATPDERQDYLAQLFIDALFPLEKVVTLLGDDSVQKEFADTKRHAAKFRSIMNYKLKRAEDLFLEWLES